MTFLPSIVVNSSCAEGEVRLSGGETEMEGRVEVCYNQVWWAVDDSYWDFSDATVVCRHLHYPSNCENKYLNSHQLSMPAAIFILHLSSFACRGNSLIYRIFWEG